MLHKRTNKRLTNTQFEAEAGRRAELLKPIETASHGETWVEPAYFRKLVEGTMKHLNSEEITTLPADVEKAYADYSNEALASCLISTMLDVIQSDQEKLEMFGETMVLASKTLKLMLEEAQAKDAWIKKRGLKFPGQRDLAKAACEILRLMEQDEKKGAQDKAA